MTSIDTVPLYGTDGERPPWWAADGSTERVTISVTLPTVLVDDLATAEREFGVAVSDLIAAYATQGVREAMYAKERHLDVLVDHSQIVGWMPSGTPVERGDR